MSVLAKVDRNIGVREVKTKVGMPRSLQVGFIVDIPWIRVGQSVWACFSTFLLRAEVQVLSVVTESH